MNISNLLSIIRIILAIPTAYLLYIEKIEYALIIGAIAAITDFFDGFLARRFNQITDLGKILDPVADKVFISIVGIALVIMRIMPLWFFIVILLRDVIILLGGLYTKKKIGLTLTSTFEGKVTFALILIVVLGLILDNMYARLYGPYLATAAMLYTLAQYYFRMQVELKNHSKKF